MTCEALNMNSSNIIDFELARAAYNAKYNDNHKKNNTNTKKNNVSFKKNNKGKGNNIIEFNPKRAAALGMAAVAGITGSVALANNPEIVTEVGNKVSDFFDYVNNKQQEFLDRLEEIFVDGEKLFFDTETNEVYDSLTVDKIYNELGENNRYQNIKPSGNSAYGDFQVVDLSSHNGSVDFNTLKQQGVDACVIRMFDAWNMNYQEDNLSCLDSNFCEYAEACDEADIPFGVYIYSRATTEDMARQEAYKFLKFASKYNVRPTFPVYYDIESQSGEPLYTPNNETVSSVDFIRDNPDQVIRNFKAFAEVLEENGYYVGIYSGDHVLSTIDPSGEKLSDYAVWLARYYYSDTVCDFNNNPVIMEPTYKGNIDMYQFSSTGRFNGTDSWVDCSYCKQNYAKAIEKYKMNRPLDYDNNEFRRDGVIPLTYQNINEEKVLKLVA